ncbi:MAG: hypothetical protein PHT25_07625 [Bacteroidales bacterium]|nr:hypothetical protein [Bacteroidales bacterium]
MKNVKIIPILFFVILMSIIAVGTKVFTIRETLTLIVSCSLFLYLFYNFRAFFTPGPWAYKNRFYIEGLFTCISCVFIPLITKESPITATNIILALSLGILIGIISGYFFKLDYHKKCARINVDESIIKEAKLESWAVFLDQGGDIEGRVILTDGKLYFAPIFIATPIREYNLDESTVNVKEIYKYGLPAGFTINNDNFKIHYTKLWIKALNNIILKK